MTESRGSKAPAALVPLLVIPSDLLTVIGSPVTVNRFFMTVIMIPVATDDFFWNCCFEIFRRRNPLFNDLYALITCHEDPASHLRTAVGYGRRPYGV